MTEQKMNDEASVTSEPIPGVQVKAPVGEVLDAAFGKIHSIIQKIPPFLSTTSAMQRVIECQFWCSMALKDLKEHEEKEATKRQAPMPTIVSDVREKVDLSE